MLLFSPPPDALTDGTTWPTAVGVTSLAWTTLKNTGGQRALSRRRKGDPQVPRDCGSYWHRRMAIRGVGAQLIIRFDVSGPHFVGGNFWPAIAQRQLATAPPQKPQASVPGRRSGIIGPLLGGHTETPAQTPPKWRGEKCLSRTTVSASFCGVLSRCDTGDQKARGPEETTFKNRWTNWREGKSGWRFSRGFFKVLIYPCDIQIRE
eukprot:scaffold2808_cov255-Pinguiococcus_pyrenoidosus.AAC.52